MLTHCDNRTVCSGLKITGSKLSEEYNVVNFYFEENSKGMIFESYISKR